MCINIIYQSEYKAKLSIVISQYIFTPDTKVERPDKVYKWLVMILSVAGMALRSNKYSYSLNRRQLVAVDSSSSQDLTEFILLIGISSGNGWIDPIPLFSHNSRAILACRIVSS